MQVNAILKSFNLGDNSSDISNNSVLNLAKVNGIDDISIVCKEEMIEFKSKEIPGTPGLLAEKLEESYAELRLQV